MGAMLRAEISDGTLAGVCLEKPLETDSCILGRADSCDMVLPDPSLSKLHLKIERAAQGWQVEDLASVNGTRLNDQRLRPGLAVQLEEGDQMRVGIFELLFLNESQVAKGVSCRHAAKGLFDQLLAHGQEAKSQPVLLVENGPMRGSRVEPAVDQQLYIGRSSDCDLVLDDRRISRRHALVQREGDSLWLTDAGSANGSWVDDVRIAGRQRLPSGSRVMLGRIRLRVLEPSAGFS